MPHVTLKSIANNPDIKEGMTRQQIDAAIACHADKAAWSSLYRTVSRAFDAPASGKIAVKVINHYGDEVLKVVPVERLLFMSGDSCQPLGFD